MKTDDRAREQFDAFDARLRSGLDTIASTTRVRPPERFDPSVMPLGVDEASPRRFKPILAMAAVAAVTVAGLLAIGTRDEEEPAHQNQPPPAAPGPAFRYETPTVRLEAVTIEVLTASGTFVPTADVVVEGDPGMPDQYTTLELWWHDDVEQRIDIYFASDGVTWWASEIRTYDGTDSADWSEPIATGRFFERPLGTPYTGDVDLPNLRITGMTLEAFIDPAACESPTAPVALIADYPAIRGWSSGGFGLSFQVYDTATCTPLPIDGYTFEFTIDDLAVATVVDIGPIGGPDVDTAYVTTPDDVPTSTAPERPQFDDIKSRVQLDFTEPGSTVLHATARDTTGAIVGTVDIPITVTAADRPDLAIDTPVPSSTTALAGA